MATTVSSAFTKFMSDYVNLDKDTVATARNSRDWLISQLNRLSDTPDNGFPIFYKEKHLGFGSFSRSTKKRELDDIDHLLCMKACQCWYSEHGSKIYINVPDAAGKPFTELTHDDGSKFLNSTKVINCFVKSMKNIPQYKNSEKHARSGEAATLKLTSYSWNFDIIPCFFTTEDTYGRTFYIIPDGNGHWKKTDPRIDRDKATSINQKNEGKVLAIIRAMKYWNKRPTMRSMSSYLLENIILDYYSLNTAGNYIDVEIKKMLNHMIEAVYMHVEDPKGIQGNINTLNFDEALSISNRARRDRDTAEEAITLEFTNPKKSIDKWREIFGNDFPEYTGS